MLEINVFHIKKNSPEAKTIPSHPKSHTGFGKQTFMAAPSNAIALDVTATVLKASVLVPITTLVAPGASEIGVPETVIIPPGVNVCPSITKSDAAFAVKICPSKLITAAFVTPGGAWPRTCVLLPKATRPLPEAASEMGVPETVI